MEPKTILGVLIFIVFMVISIVLSDSKRQDNSPGVHFILGVLGASIGILLHFSQ